MQRHFQSDANHNSEMKRTQSKEFVLQNLYSVENNIQSMLSKDLHVTYLVSGLCSVLCVEFHVALVLRSIYTEKMFQKWKRKFPGTPLLTFSLLYFQDVQNEWIRELIYDFKQLLMLKCIFEHCISLYGLHFWHALKTAGVLTPNPKRQECWLPSIITTKTT